MRVGALSDRTAYRHQPMPFQANQRHFQLLHPERTNKRGRRKHEDERLKPAHRAITPIHAHADLAQLLGGKFEDHMEAFGRNMDLSLLPTAKESYRATVSKFNANTDPKFSTETSLMNPDNAWFMQKMSMQPEKHMGNAVNWPVKPKQKPNQTALVADVTILADRMLTRAKNAGSAERMQKIEELIEELQEIRNA